MTGRRLEAVKHDNNTTHKNLFMLDANVRAAVEFALGEVYLIMQYLQKRALRGSILHPPRVFRIVAE